MNAMLEHFSHSTLPAWRQFAWCLGNGLILMTANVNRIEFNSSVIRISPLRLLMREEPSVWNSYVNKCRKSNSKSLYAMIIMVQSSAQWEDAFVRTYCIFPLLLYVPGVSCPALVHLPGIKKCKSLQSTNALWYNSYPPLWGRFTVWE